MIRLSISVQAHETRRQMALQLAETVGASDVVFDPEPNGSRSPWRTYRLALERAPKDATHVVILQDDVLPCPHFAEVAPRAVQERPAGLLCFFVQGEPAEISMAVWHACDRGEAFCDLPLTAWCPAVATCWPTSVIPAFLDWYDRQGFPAALTADDEIIGRAVRALRIPVHATVPNLVEHPDVVESVRGRRRAMAGRDRSRISACFVHPDDDPRDIRWA